MSYTLVSRRTALALGLSLGLAGSTFAAEVSILNVSYDPTRELYQDFNAAFAKRWKAQSGDDVTVKQSHGGSGQIFQPSQFATGTNAYSGALTGLRANCPKKQLTRQDSAPIEDCSAPPAT